MVHLSVAIGRFFEALLFALARTMGVVALAIVGALAVLLLLLALARTAWRRRRR